MAQDAVRTGWWPSVMMFGRPTDESPKHGAVDGWKIKKRFDNDELRQRGFIDCELAPGAELGLSPSGPPTCDFNERAGHHDCARSDWTSSGPWSRGEGRWQRHAWSTGVDEPTRTVAGAVEAATPRRQRGAQDRGGA